MSDPLVLVTGASGFVASHVTRQLQEDGWRVRVTVRDATNEKKVKPLSSICPNAKFPLEIVEADLLNAESWPKAVEGCTYVMHVASPFPFDNPKTPEEIIKPALDGTLNVLEACAKAGTVKRVVVTGSVVAIGAPGVKKNNHFSEEDWLKESDVMDNFYMRSKILAEQAAFKFVDDLPADKKFEVATVNPGLVLGPVLHGAAGTSIDIIKQLLERAQPVTIGFAFCVCDVRDVAVAHVRCMTTPEAAGHRHIVSSGSFWMKEIAAILDGEFRSQGYRVPRFEVPKTMASFMGLFVKQVRMGLKIAGERLSFDNTRMREVLKMSPTPAEKAILDMAYSLIEKGFVFKTDKYRGPPNKDSSGKS